MIQRERPDYENGIDNYSWERSFQGVIRDLDRAWQAIEELQGLCRKVEVKIPIKLDKREILRAAVEGLREGGFCAACEAAPAPQAPPTAEERERDILLRAEAVEALRRIRNAWQEIQDNHGVGWVRIEARGLPAWVGMVRPWLGLPGGKLEYPLRQLAAEWMERFVLTAELLCLDVIERGEAAIPLPLKAEEKGAGSS
jgi:hypothetical protein